MFLDNYYWYFQSAVPLEDCNKIIKKGKSKKVEKAMISDDKKEFITKKEKRNSQVVWLDERWIYDIIQPFVHTANRNAGWNFEWDWSEPAQFTFYKKGMHYNWHTDSLPKPYEKGTSKGKIRKLTSVLVLSDPREYQGGELEFQFHAEDPQYNKKRTVTVAKEVAPKGSIIVFPSFVWHRVKPVTKGVRYSMPTWHLGWPFK